MSQMESTTVTTPSPLATTPNETITQGSPSSSGGGMTYDQVMNTWIQAGGNPQAASMAAAVADASSGLNPGASYTNPDGTISVGLWLIPQNGMPPGTTDPIANARAAIQMSGNGTDWSSWCVAWSDNACGQNSGTYLGEGSDALGSLAQKLGPSSYNVIGAQPTGNGTSASSAGGSTTGPTTSSKSYLTIGLLIVLLLVVFVMVRRKTSQNGEATESQGRSQASWSPDEENLIRSSNLSDRELSSQTGRSVRAIRVRRNQLGGS